MIFSYSLLISWFTPIRIDYQHTQNLGLVIYPYPIPKPKIVFDTQKLCVLSMGVGYGYHTHTQYPNPIHKKMGISFVCYVLDMVWYLIPNTHHHFWVLNTILSLYITQYPDFFCMNLISKKTAFLLFFCLSYYIVNFR